MSTLRNTSRVSAQKLVEPEDLLRWVCHVIHIPYGKPIYILDSNYLYATRLTEKTNFDDMLTDAFSLISEASDPVDYDNLGPIFGN